MKRRHRKPNRILRDVPLQKAAALFGCTARVMRMFVKKGMPHAMGKRPKRGGKRPVVVNLKEVESWGLEHDVRALREPMATKPQHVPQLAAAPAETKDPKKLPEFGIAAELVRMRKVVFHLYQQFVMATKAGDDKRVRVTNRNYMDACKQLTDMEKVADARKELERQVRDELATFVSNWIVPIRSMLDAMPRTLAPRFSPCESSKAERTLRDEIENKLLPMMARKIEL